MHLNSAKPLHNILELNSGFLEVDYIIAPFVFYQFCVHDNNNYPVRNVTIQTPVLEISTAPEADPVTLQGRLPKSRVKLTRFENV